MSGVSEDPLASARSWLASSVEELLSLQRDFPTQWALRDADMSTIPAADRAMVVAIRQAQINTKLAENLVLDAEARAGAASAAAVRRLETEPHPAAAGPGGSWGDRKDLAAHASGADAEFRALRVFEHHLHVAREALAPLGPSLAQAGVARASAAVGAAVTAVEARLGKVDAEFMRRHTVAQANSWRVLDFCPAWAWCPRRNSRSWRLTWRRRSRPSRRTTGPPRRRGWRLPAVGLDLDA